MTTTASSTIDSRRAVCTSDERDERKGRQRAADRPKVVHRALKPTLAAVGVARSTMPSDERPQREPEPRQHAFPAKRERGPRRVAGPRGAEVYQG